jgi:hypothetical protein
VTPAGPRGGRATGGTRPARPRTTPPAREAASGPKPAGSLRQSQIITTYGPGAMVDLLDAAVLVSGLEFWRGTERRAISEPRLTQRLATVLGVPALRLVAPPVEDEAHPTDGLPVFRFPRFFVTRYEERRGPLRRRRLVHQSELDHAQRFHAPDRSLSEVLPVRFVQGCPNGHLSDLEWYAFVHAEALDTSGGAPCPRTLWIEERGTSGDLAETWVLCDCGAARSMARAKRGDAPLGFCRGRLPWLGDDAAVECRDEHDKPVVNRLLLRSASDAWFPQVASAIALPDRGARLTRAVDSVWDDHLAYLESVSELERERRRGRVATALWGFSDAEVWDEMQRRRGALPAAPTGLRQAEMETLLGCPDETVADDGGEPDDDFRARRLVAPAAGLMPDEAALLAPVERVVLVHRLREVRALIGFTRFDAPVADVDGELALDVRRAPLARDTRFLPAVEHRGEGVFLALRREAVQDWLDRPAVRQREARLRDGHAAWQQRHAHVDVTFPGAAYVLLHSLSHLLITAVSLECGYAASAIRERLYVTPAGFGLLLSTGTSDAEGTLGGLVEVGRRLGHYLRVALELGRLCSNDPVCAQHRPDRAEEERFLQGAACHGCLLIAEPSCERRNEYLDRALVVSTLDACGAEFFPDPA